MNICIFFSPVAQAQGTMNAVEVAAIVAQAVNATLTVVQQPPPQVQVVAPVLVQFPIAWERVRDAFQKAHPPEFWDSSDVVITSQRKKDIQRHLRMYECIDIQRQLLATFKLVGAALQWWESTTTLEDRNDSEFLSAVRPQVFSFRRSDRDEAKITGPHSGGENSRRI